MANPFDAFDAPAQAQGGGNPFDQFHPEDKKAAAKDWQHLSVLPFDVSKDGQDFQFNSDAGIIGSIKRALTLPGDVATGKVDPKSQEGIGRALELGALGTPMSAGMRAGEGGLIGLRQAEAKPPTAEELRAAAKGGYNQARSLGVDYAPQAVSDLSGSIARDLNGQGFIPRNAPTAHGILEDLAAIPQVGSGESAVVPFDNLHAARKALRILSQEKKDGAATPNAAAASIALRHLDGFMESPPATGVLAGPAADAGRLLQEANGNYAAAARSNKLNGIEDAADLRAAAANSGQNTGNAIRSRVASLLLNPKQISGYSPEEIAALREVSEGTTPRNVARYVGNLLGGGGGLGAVVSGGVGGAAGGAVGGPFGALAGMALPAVGMAAKAMDTAGSRRALGVADALTRERSPLFRQMQSDAPMIEQYPAARDALVRALMMRDGQQ